MGSTVAVAPYRSTAMSTLMSVSGKQPDFAKSSLFANSDAEDYPGFANSVRVVRPRLSCRRLCSRFMSTRRLLSWSRLETRRILDDGPKYDWVVDVAEVNGGIAKILVLLIGWRFAEPTDKMPLGHSVKCYAARRRMQFDTR